MFTLKNVHRKTTLCLLSTIMVLSSGIAFARPLHNPGIGSFHSKIFPLRPIHGKRFHHRKANYYLPPLFRELNYMYLANRANRKQKPTVIIVPARQTLPVYSPGTEINRSTGKTLIINIPNSNGSYTQVTLRKHRDGLLGPQGEYYPEDPSVEQLRILYAS